MDLWKFSRCSYGDTSFSKSINKTMLFLFLPIFLSSLERDNMYSHILFVFSSRKVSNIYKGKTTVSWSPILPNLQPEMFCNYVILNKNQLLIQTDNLSACCFVGLISLVAQLVENLPAMWETWVQSLNWEDSLQKGRATHSSNLALKIP